MSDHGNQTPISATAPATQKTLVLSGADLDQATTVAAIAAIQAGQNDNPLIANLTTQQKQEIVDGQRKFYKLPVIPADAQYAPAAPAAQPAAHHAQTPAAQPAPAHVVPHATGPGDIVQIVLDGVVYGSYNITTSPFTLDAPLKMGDIWSVSCLQLAAGKSSVTVGIGTDLNPVQATLSVGQSETYTVTAGPAATTAQDYAWFHTQAANGNPVAEYGLGHMYEYGIGVPQNTSQAVYWYRQAANQHYLDATQRLAELGQ
jgi:TPR repeat protein